MTTQNNGRGSNLSNADRKAGGKHSHGAQSTQTKTSRSSNQSHSSKNNQR